MTEAMLGLDRWLEFLGSAEIPVLKQSARELAVLREDAGRLDTRSIAQVIKRDPLMTVKLRSARQPSTLPSPATSDPLKALVPGKPDVGATSYRRPPAGRPLERRVRRHQRRSNASLTPKATRIAPDERNTQVSTLGRERSQAESLPAKMPTGALTTNVSPANASPRTNIVSVGYCADGETNCGKNAK
jgi:hypothetical protein